MYHRRLLLIDACSFFGGANKIPGPNLQMLLQVVSLLGDILPVKSTRKMESEDPLFYQSLSLPGKSVLNNLITKLQNV